ncbi:MAG TPA: DNA polymerase I, partial [Edaphobacter sp.]
DMMQLVTKDVSILNPTKDNLVLDPAGVEANLGVPPERVIDVMALRGDSIDNIPGAPGIGDKGSVELIQQFGTVEAAIDAATATPDAIKRKTYRESLANNRDNILLSKELVTIHTEVPIEYSLDDMRTQAPDLAACRDLFSELEFTTLLKELAPAADTTVITYELKPTAVQLKHLLEEARAINPATSKPNGLAVAIAEDAQAISEEIAAEPADDEKEPPPAENMSLFGVAAAEPPVAVIVADSEAPASRVGLAVNDHFAIEISLEEPGIKEALADADLPKDVHDLKAVLRALESHQVELKGVRNDVMLLSYLINPTHGSHTLVDIAARSTSRTLLHQPTKENPSDARRLAEAAAAIVRLSSTLGGQIADSTPMQHEIPVDDPALGGAVTTEMLFADKKKADAAKEPARNVSPLQHVYETIDLPLVPVLLRMEQTGVRIDPEFLRGMSSRLAVEIDNLAEKIYSDSGHRFNINSPKQLGDVLFNKMLLPKPMKYGKGKVVSTAQDVLEELAESHPIAALVIEHRQLQKLKGTYLDALPVLVDSEDRIHTTFNQVGTATGRLSSTNPNLQNIPIRTAIGREIRAAFIAAKGNLLMSADYSQIELRLMAHFSEDPLLVDAYRTGKDIHTLTASEVFEVDPETMDKETRNRAKAVNFGIVYGISPFGLAAQLGIDQKTAREYIERYFERYSGVQRFIERTLAEVKRAQSVSTYFGRVRPIPDIQSRNPNMRGFAERTAVNTPLQGTAADLIKLAMLKIDAELTRRKLHSKMTLQVHDELLFDVVPEEAKEVEALVKHEMEHVQEFNVPIVAEVGLGDNWRDIK